MKKARANDHWRRVEEDPPIAGVVALEFGAHAVLAKNSLTFSRNVNAICGKNGSGKTSLLGTIVRAIGVVSLDDARCGQAARRGSEHFTARVLLDGHEHDAPVGSPALALDTSVFAAHLMDGLRRVPDLDELAEQNGGNEWSARDRGYASYVVGRTYQKLTVREVEGILGTEVVPFFEVERDGVSYRSEDMGQGELAALCLLWFLKSMDRGTIVVLEEPEAHLPPASQRALADVIAYYADQRKCWFILSTHSPHMMERIPVDSIHLAINGKFQPIDKRSDYLRLLGSPMAQRLLVFVEDTACRKFFERFMMEEGFERGPHELEMVVMGSDSEAIAAAAGLPAALEPQDIFFGLVVDGDGDDSWKRKVKCPVAVIPAGSSPEKLLLGAVKVNLNVFGQEIGVEPRALELAFEELDGRDIHDQFVDTAKRVGVDYDVFFRQAYLIWRKGADPVDVLAFRKSVLEVLRTSDQDLEPVE